MKKYVVWGLSLACPFVVPADTHYVSLSGANVYPYTSWANAATTIQAAVSAASDGDTVLVTNGTYVLSAVIPIHKNITVKSAKGSRYTIIDGNGSVRCIHMDKPRAVVDGFTITRGKTSYGGGGIFMINTGIVQNCVIKDNVATNSNGGGIYAALHGRIYNCVITNNTAYGHGGGMYLSGQTRCAITNTTIANNYAYSGGGAGIYCVNASPAISTSRIINNACYGNGGGMRIVTNSRPTITSSLISGNKAYNDCYDLGMCSDSHGGGISAESDSALTFNRSTNTSNYASNDGGGIYIFQAAAELTDSIVRQNSIGYGRGGGIEITESTDTFIENCTIHANAAYGSDGMRGGGISCDNSDPVIYDSQIVNNLSSIGGGFYITGQSSPLIENCAILSNRAAESFMDGYGGGVYCRDASPQIIHCEISHNRSSWNGGGLVFIDSDYDNTIVSECFIRYNTNSLADGGGMYIQDSSLSILNSVINHNKAEGYGGGISIYQSENLEFVPLIRNCTLAYNQLDDYYGYAGCNLNVFTETGVTGELPEVQNTILWGKCYARQTTTGSLSANSEDGTVAMIIDYSDIQNGNDIDQYNSTVSYGNNNITADPEFISDGWKIESDSPCFEAGNSVLVQTGETDIEGQPRIQDGDVDIGADEAIP